MDATGLTPVAELPDAAERMAATLAHRGPDDEGVWSDPTGHVAFGHRRLSVLDPSPLGRQPMTSADGRYTVVFNGEIYNFRELQRILGQRGHRFRGGSDTEVLLAAISEWGITGALERSNGMFALATWDARRRMLHLARDRLGEKPLYYGWFDGTLLFGSELRALRAHPSFVGRVDPGAVALYLRLTHVPAPHSIYADVYKVLPGHLVTVRDTTSVEEQPYWSLEAQVLAARDDPFRGSISEAAAHVEGLIRDSVRVRLESDVPLGAFLSGGIDSSMVVAAMQAESRTRARTFTVSFADAGYDEAHRAAEIARHLGTDHTEVPVTADDALAVVDRLPDLYDEPLADPSQLPTAVMCAAARRHVTVCLSGDGGDEVFGGYNRYLYGGRLWSRFERVPRPLRVAAAHLLAIPSHRQLAALTGAVPAVGARLPNVADKLQKLVTLLPARDEEDAYRRLVSAWPEPERMLRSRQGTPADQSDMAGTLADPISRMMLRDTLTALPDGMLVKVDRASMAVGLEVRVPLLDHRLVEFAWRLPVTWKIRNGTGKWLLRQILARYVPARLTEAPKMGFDPPIGAWLRGPLREWADSLLAPDRLRDENLFDPVEIRTRWVEHLRGRRNWDYPLWTVLVYEAWRERLPQHSSVP